MGLSWYTPGYPPYFLACPFCSGNGEKLCGLSTVHYETCDACWGSGRLVAEPDYNYGRKKTR